jgi:tripeptidyl-peptidase-2
LAPTGVPAFSQLAPTQDGRGVLIAILDSGIDPSAPGLTETSDGQPKLLDLRDLSGEGAIALQSVTVIGDTVAIGHHRLVGASIVRANPDEPVWAGLVAEVRYGYGPGADLDDDGVVGDTMLVVVTRGTSEWLVFADTDRDGSLADERPVRDFATAQEWFGWSSRGRLPPVGIAVTVHDSAGGPSLTLVFDTSGHGTHVAGIAAGHDLYGVPGFDGVAPGARLLGLKIANNANRVTTSGSMRRALAYAVAFARRVRLPLVINLSFGVGNLDPWRTRIDAVVDSILDANPDVILTVAATNDGPGLGTLGFPATARRVVSVGATAPQVFSGRSPHDPTPDPVAWYSSRGGPRAGPDLVAPGTAWSVVPRFLGGQEEKSGTSMAAPHVAGLAARLYSAMLQQDRAPDRSLVVQALVATAAPLPEATLVDQGAGLPDLPAAARWLVETSRLPRIDASIDALDGRAALVFGPGPIPSHAQLWLRRTDARTEMPIRIRSTAPWLQVEGSSLRMLPTSGLVLHLVLDTAALAAPGVRVGSVIVEDAANRRLGPLVRVPVTVRVPLLPGGTASGVVAVHAGGVGRQLFLADSGIGLRVAVRTLSDEGRVLAALHEPGGQPYREIPIRSAGQGDGSGVVEVAGSDVRSGAYEVVVVAPPSNGVAARVEVTRSPLRLMATLRDRALAVRAVNLSETDLDIDLRAYQQGIGRRDSTGWQSDGTLAMALVVPPWAAALVLDVSLPGEVWSQLTDFSVSLRGASGRLIQEAPLNHSFGRVRVRIPAVRAGETLTLLLTPAFADAEARARWQAEVVTRFEAAEGLPVDGGGAGRARLGPGAVRVHRVAPVEWPLTVPPGWAPLLTVRVHEGAEHRWTHQLILASGRGVSE